MQALPAIVFALLASTWAAGACAQALAVRTIEARLFFAHSGSFSEPLSENQPLWNVVIGESGASEPSTATLVKVLVAGPPRAFDRNARVVLQIDGPTPKATRSRQSKRLGVFDESGRQYVAFWLADTGCEPLRLSASLSGSKEAVVRTLQFACGE